MHCNRPRTAKYTANGCLWQRTLFVYFALRAPLQWGLVSLCSERSAEDSVSLRLTIEENVEGNAEAKAIRQPVTSHGNTNRIRQTKTVC